MDKAVTTDCGTPDPLANGTGYSEDEEIARNILREFLTRSEVWHEDADLIAEYVLDDSYLTQTIPRSQQRTDKVCRLIRDLQGGTS